MTETYIIVRPRSKERESVQLVKMMQFMFENDVHKWVIASETGNSGYEHWQVRFSIRNLTEDEKKDHAFLKANFGKSAHIELASDTWKYERKEGLYYTSWDTIEVLQQRYGTRTNWQERAYNVLQRTNDREIVVCYDESGNHGKSWFTGHLWEIGEAHIVQAQNNAKGLIQDCASEYLDNGWRPIVIIDIPRTWKWTDDLYVAIERIKDGLIKDARYGSRTINIHGVKVLVFCNQAPDKEKLSDDRWVIGTICGPDRDRAGISFWET